MSWQPLQKSVKDVMAPYTSGGHCGRTLDARLKAGATSHFARSAFDPPANSPIFHGSIILTCYTNWLLGNRVAFLNVPAARRIQN
jgi:hypothetical protein